MVRYYDPNNILQPYKGSFYSPSRPDVSPLRLVPAEGKLGAKSLKATFDAELADWPLRSSKLHRYIDLTHGPNPYRY